LAKHAKIVLQQFAKVACQFSGLAICRRRARIFTRAHRCCHLDPAHLRLPSRARADNSAASSRAPQGRPVSIYFDPSVLTASTSSSRSVACDGAKEPGRRRAQHPVVAALGDIGRRQEPRSVLGDRPAPVVAKNPDQVPAASAIRYPASSFPRRSPCLLDLVARVPPLVQL